MICHLHTLENGYEIQDCDLWIENTIEGIIYDILNAKKRIIGTVMGDIQQDETNVVEEILKSISQRR